MPEIAGEGLGRFELIRELGTGRQGTVHLARLREECYRKPKGSLVAIKFLREDLLRNKKALTRFHEEAKIGRKLHHPNIVRIYALETTELLGLPVLYLVMEYLEGSNLRQFLDQKGAAVEALVRRIGREASLGLAALHRNGIVHRDIKPENICLTVHGNTKLMDLGFAATARQADGRAASSGGLLGTVRYTAPECLRGLRAMAPADIYSLGVVLFELATGHHPFEEAAQSGNADQLIDAHLHAEVPPPSSLRPRLSAFVDKVLLTMLAKEPAQRRLTAAELARTWKQGERSAFWRQWLKIAPILRSEQRLRRTRRPALIPYMPRKSLEAELDRAFELSRKGRFEALWFRGPEGSGKRRLIDAWTQRLLQRGQRLAYFPGEPQPRSQERLLSPIGDFLIEEYCQDDGTQDKAAGLKPENRDLQIEKLTARFQSKLELGEASADRLSRWLLGDAENQKTFPKRLLAEALRQMGTNDSPLIMRLHRAERLDNQTVRLLEVLATLPGKTPVLLLLSSHSEDRRPTLGELPVREIEVTELDENESTAFMAQVFESQTEAEDVARQLRSQVPPLPGLLLESCAYLHSKGQLSGSPGKYKKCKRRISLAIEGGLENFLKASWASLQDSEMELLEAASILGPRFRIEDLSPLLGRPELELLEALSALRETWILSYGDALRFRRRSQRKFVLTLIPDERRIGLHKKAAEILSKGNAGPTVIGMQWSRAAEHEKALPHLLEALRGNIARGDLDRSKALARRTRLHLNALPRIARILELRLVFAELSARLALHRGRPQEAEIGLLRAISMASILHKPKEQAVLRQLLAEATLNRGRFTEALVRIDEALPRFELPLQLTNSLELRLMKAEILALTGSLRSGLEIAALVRGECDEDSHGLLYGRATMLLARMHAARLAIETSERYFSEARDVFEEYSAFDEVLELRLLRARMRLESGSLQEARREVRALAELFTTPKNRARSLELAGLSLQYEGKDEEALETLAAARKFAESAGDAYTLLGIRIRALDSEAELGRGALERSQRLLDEARASQLPRPLLHTGRIHARLLRENAEPAAALVLVQDRLNKLRRLTIEPTLVLGLQLEKAHCLGALEQLDGQRRTLRIANALLLKLARRMPGRGGRQRFLEGSVVRRRLLLDGAG